MNDHDNTKIIEITTECEEDMFNLDMDMLGRMVQDHFYPDEGETDTPFDYVFYAEGWDMGWRNVSGWKTFELPIMSSNPIEVGKAFIRGVTGYSRASYGVILKLEVEQTKYGPRPIARASVYTHDSPTGEGRYAVRLWDYTCSLLDDFTDSELLYALTKKIEQQISKGNLKEQDLVHIFDGKSFEEFTREELMEAIFLNDIFDSTYQADSYTEVAEIIRRVADEVSRIIAGGGGE